jgi:alkanesulfonate monooxygenase SsuD/methylene tetrahydromethanopterin reductase-like flavin-dependent oxidoreductase (luciferase family)
LEFLGGTYRSDFDAMLDRVACVGNLEQVTDRLGSFVAAGADHLVLVPVGRSGQETARRLLLDVLPKLRAGATR